MNTRIVSKPPPPKTAPPPQQRRLSATEQNEYSKIIKQLKLQINECKSDASFLSTNNDNNNDQQLQQQQDQLLQYAKQSEMMLQKVIQCQKQELETPTSEYFTINVKMQNLNKEIEENELRLIVTKLSNISTKGTVDCYCTLKIENLLDTHTSTQKAKFSCNFNYTKRCKIQRDKKLKHKIKFGKLFIHLYQKRLFGDSCLGQAILKLKPLLESSTLKQTITLKPENERKKIADLDIEIRLRKPVLTEGYTTVTKKLIRITKFPISKPRQTQQPPKQTQQQQPQRPRQQSQPQRPRQPSQPQQPQQPQRRPRLQSQPVSTKKNNENVNLPNGLTQEIVDNPLGIEYIESFECITAEIEQCQKEIAKSNGKNAQDLQDRLQGLMTNKNILEIQVNNGILTLEQYTAKVKQAMIVDLALAKYLKTQNRKMEAVRVLQRYKLMKKEIEGT